MKPTDTSEQGLEALIVQHLCAHGYILGNPKDYQADVALDTVQLLAFLQVTQPEAVDSCTGCKVKSQNAAWWMCCARG